MLAYTMRKDLTLEDVIEGVEWISLIDKTKAIDALKFSRVLIESAIDHTDGKETQYFPNSWFGRFLRIDFHAASLYLLDLLSNYRYYWIAERALIDLLCNSNGSVNPIIELYLTFSFPCNDSEEFVNYCLSLQERLKEDHPEESEKLIARIVSVTQPRHNRRFSKETTSRYNKVVANFDGSFIISNEANIPRKKNSKWLEESIVVREEFSNMDPDELSSYFEIYGINSNDINALCYRFEQYSTLDKGIKQLIQTIVQKNNSLYSDRLNLDAVFKTGTEIECYYWVCRFFFDQGGWFQRFVNQQAFASATTIDQVKAMEFLFELMPSALDIGFNFTFSSNLIRALINVGHNKDEIADMWDGLLDVTSYRLPFQEGMEWDSIMADEFAMSIEEIFIYMLLCRFKAATTERFRNVTIGIEAVFENFPEKFEKPIKWFIKNRENFLQPAVSIVLQMLLSYQQKDGSYHLKFEKILKSIFPTHYFLHDLIIAELYNLDIPNIHLPEGIIYPALSRNEWGWFSRYNKRFKPMLISGIDLEPVFRKYKAGFQRKYQDHFELYQNRTREQWAPHIYSSDFFGELINIDLYNQLRQWQIEDESDILKYSCLIDTTAMIAYGKCFTFRPTDLIKPSDLQSDYEELEISDGSDWIRLGHCEKELKDDGILRTRSVTSYGAILYSNTTEKVLPYSSYDIFPFFLWTDHGYEFKCDEKVVFAIFQNDALESYKILWLNPTIVKGLRLTTKITESGLVGTTESGEAVLRMRTWLTDYFGDSYNSRLSDEIPRYEGTDLIIRNDYFQKLCEMFKNAPSYVITKVEGRFITEGNDD